MKKQISPKLEISAKESEALWNDVDALIINPVGAIKAKAIHTIKAVIESPKAEEVAYPLVSLLNGKFGKGFAQWLKEVGFKIEKGDEGYFIAGFTFPDCCENAEDVAIYAEGCTLDIIEKVEKHGTEKEKKVKTWVKPWSRLDASVIEDVRKTLRKKIASEYKTHKASATVHNFINDFLLSEDFVRDALIQYLASKK